MSGTAHRLDHRILPEFDFTLRDEVITQLLQFIECPISQEATSDMVIFNHQCYDKDNWVKHLAVSDEYNLGRRNSGYGPSQCDRLIDPRSGAALSYRDSMRRLYFEEVNRQDLRQIVTHRVTMLQTSEVDDFIPNNYIISVNELVSHIRRIGDFRKPVRDIYHMAMENQRLASEESRTTSDDTPSERRGSRNPSTSPSTALNHPATNATNNTSARTGSSNSITNPNPNTTSIMPSATLATNQSHQSDSDSSVSVQFTTRRFQNRNILDNLSTTTSENEFVDSQSIDISNTPPPPSNVTIMASIQTTTTAVTNTNTNTNNDESAAVGTTSETAINVLTQPSTSTFNNVDNEDDDNSPTGNGNSSRTSSNLPSFTNCADGEIICLGILQSAKINGYAETLYHGARVNWFTRMIPQWVLPGGILHGYRSPHPKTLRKKFRDAERLNKNMMDRRQHQPDSTGVRDESRPLCFTAFMDYFEFVEQRNAIRAMERNVQVRREAVTRTLIGQMPALSTQPSAIPELLPTTATGNRERGASTIGENVNVNTTSLTDTPISTTNPPPPTRLRQRNNSSNNPRSTRARRHNVDYGMTQSPILPPSTGRWRAFDVERMENTYVGIANAINNLANQSLVRRPQEINDDIINTLQEKMAAQRNNIDDSIIRAYDIKLSDLNEELLYSRRLLRRMTQSLDDEEEHESNEGTIRL